MTDYLHYDTILLSCKITETCVHVSFDDIIVTFILKDGVIEMEPFMDGLISHDTVILKNSVINDHVVYYTIASVLLHMLVDYGIVLQSRSKKGIITTLFRADDVYKVSYEINERITVEGNEVIYVKQIYDINDVSDYKSVAFDDNMMYVLPSLFV
jgi:hypothetical protein